MDNQVKQKLLEEIKELDVYRGFERADEVFEQVKSSGDNELMQALAGVYRDSIGEAWQDAVGLKWSPPKAGFDVLFEYVERIRVLDPNQPGLDKLETDVKKDMEDTLKQVEDGKSK